MRSLSFVFTAALALTVASPVRAQAPFITAGGDYTATFTGDDFDGLDSALGIRGGLLFRLGPISFVGAEVGYAGVDLEGASSGDDLNLLDLALVTRVGLGYADAYRPYVDLRAGYGRLSFDFQGFEPAFDGSIDGPFAGGGLGVMIRTGPVWLDLHGRYQHHWFGQTDLDDFVFESETSGGRVVIGAALGIPIG